MNSYSDTWEMWGVFEESRPPGRLVRIFQGSQEAPGVHRGEKATQEGEGTKFESALPTLSGKVSLRASQAERG